MSVRETAGRTGPALRSGLGVEEAENIKKYQEILRHTRKHSEIQGNVKKYSDWKDEGMRVGEYESMRV